MISQLCTQNVTPPSKTATSIPASSAAPEVDLEAGLKRVQGQIAATKQAIDTVETRRAQRVRESNELYGRTNTMADQLQSVYDREKRLVHLNRFTCYTGMAVGASAGMGMMGLMNHPSAHALGLLLAECAYVGAAIITVEITKIKLAKVQPQARSLTGQWNAMIERMHALGNQNATSTAEVARLEGTLNKLRSEEEVMLMAQGVSNPPEKTVRREEDAVMIGQLRIPRRSKAAENFEKKH